MLLSTTLALALISGMSVAYFYRHLNGNLNRVEIGQDIIAPRPEAVDPGPEARSTSL